MFSKQSRYYALPDEVTLNKTGQPQPAKSLRLLPPAEGDFQHTITANDRLDHLAYQYYQQPLRWWRIADANPDILSPFALLGQEPLLTVRFHLVWPDENDPPPWAALCLDLLAQPGVDDLLVEDGLLLSFSTPIIEGEVLSTATSTPSRSILIVLNTLLLTPVALIARIASHGFQQIRPDAAMRLGQTITIPPVNARTR